MRSPPTPALPFAPRQLSMPFDPEGFGDQPLGPTDGAHPADPASCWRPPASRRRSVTMTSADLLPAAVLKRKAVVYVRQSTQAQVQSNLESQRRQYELVEVARRRAFMTSR